MINICRLRHYFIEDMVLITKHESERARQRNIMTKDIRAGVMSGEIIEQYPTDFPFPSCLISGFTTDGRPIHIVMSDDGIQSRIITAYIPTDEHWKADFRTRKEQ